MPGKKKMVELIAAHTYIEPEDYFTAEAYMSKIASVFGKIDAAREKNADGTHRWPALAAFPENIGTFLGVVDNGKLVRNARTAKEAMTRIAPKKFFEIAAAMILHGTTSLNEAMFTVVAPRVHDIYYRTFSDMARRFNIHVTAGSALLPINKLGQNTPRFRAASSHIYNTSYTFAPDGECINVTRKVNVVPTQEDVLDMSAWPAENNSLIETPFGRVGNAICYDGFIEPHTDKEPDFRPIALEYDHLGADIIVQPSANPWYWDEPWVFNDPGEDLIRRDQWICEGLFASMKKMRRARYGLNPHIIGRMFDAHFDGKSYILERKAGNEVVILAESARAHIAPETEEILIATVPVPVAT